MKTSVFETFVSFRIFLLIYTLSGVASQQLRISALGRYASLGEVYDIRNDLFTGENIFEDLPTQNQSFIEVTTLKRKSTKTQIIRSLWDKVKLMGIEVPQAINVLDGSVLPKGTSKYLLHFKDDNYVPEAATFHTTETVKASLKLFRKSMAPIIDHETLERSLGTHVVVGISYGMNAIFSLRATSNAIEEAHKQEQLLEILENLPSKYNQTFNKNLKFKVFPDIHFSQVNIPQFADASSLVQSILNNTNQGKGVPLKYFLLPLEQIKHYVGIQTPSTNFTHIDEILLENVISNFVSISNTHYQLQTEPLLCYSEGDQNEIQNLTKHFEKRSKKFRLDLKRTLKFTLSGKLEESDLIELLDNFSTSSYSPQNIFKSFQKSILENSSARNLVCKILVNKGVEYLQKHSKLEEIISKTENKPLFVLFFNSTLISIDKKAWQENLSLLSKLKKPWNRVLAVDCEAFEDACYDVIGTSIRQYLDFAVVSNNLLEDLKNFQVTFPELKIPSIGAPKQLGDLYDATSGTFIESPSLFKPRSSISLITTFKDRTVVHPSIVTSNKWQKFLQDLEIPQDQKLLILRKENIFQNGLLKNFNLIRNHPVSLEKILHQTNIYHEEYLNYEDDHIDWASLISPNTFQSRATHFVQKIYKGSTTLIGILHPNPQQEQNILDKINTILDEKVNRIENQGAQNLTKLFEKIDPDTKFFVFTDDQASTPGKIYDLSKFQELLKNISDISIGEENNPVGYVLVPLVNFLDKFGFVPNIPKLPSPLSPETSEKVLTALDVLEDTSSQKQILTWKDQMLQNSECILQTDQIAFNSFAKDLENTTNFWKAELNSLLDAYRKQEDEDQERIFMDFSASFEESYSKVEERQTKFRQIVSSVKDKITFCKLCRESSVKYISSSAHYTSALLGDAGEKRIYLMFYRQEWVQTKRDIWFKKHVKFFESLKREVGNNSTSSSQRYLVDCDFFSDASDLICANISQPTIHEYKNGHLVSQDVESTLEQEESAKQELLEQLQVSHQKLYLDTITNFNSINSTLTKLTDSNYNNEVLRRVFIDNVLQNPRAKLFTEANKTGNFEVYDFKSATKKGDCYALKKYAGKIKSVETDGSCVRLFSGSHCYYWSQAVYPGSTNITDAKLNGVHSIGPCVSNEFEHSTIIKSTSSTAPFELEKLTSALNSFANVPDLIAEFHARSGWTSVSTSSSNPVSLHLLGPGNRVETLYGNIYPRHLKSPASAEDARVAGLQQSFYSKLELEEGDEPGFTIPLELGGPADQFYNVFPQNRKQARYFKGKIVPLVKQLLTDYSSQDVVLTVSVVYKDSSTKRPSGMWYWVYRQAQEMYYGYVPNSE